MVGPAQVKDQTANSQKSLRQGRHMVWDLARCFTIKKKL